MDSYHTHTIPDAGTGDYTSSVYLLVYISVPEHIRKISALANGETCFPSVESYHLWDLGAQLGRVSFNFISPKTNLGFKKSPRIVFRLSNHPTRISTQESRRDRNRSIQPSNWGLKKESPDFFPPI